MAACQEPRGLQLGGTPLQLCGCPVPGARGHTRGHSQCCVRPRLGESLCVPFSPKGLAVIFSIFHKKRQGRAVRNVPRTSQRSAGFHPRPRALSVWRGPLMGGGQATGEGPGHAGPGRGWAPRGEYRCLSQRGCAGSSPKHSASPLHLFTRQ